MLCEKLERRNNTGFELTPGYGDLRQKPVWRQTSMMIKDYSKQVETTIEQKVGSVFQNYELGENPSQISYEELPIGTDWRRPILINSPKGRFVIKYATGDLSKAEFIISVILQASKKGIPVPEIYETKKGNHFVKIGSSYYFLENYIESGNQLSRTKMQHEHFSSLGGLAAKIHETFSGFKPRGAKRELLAIDVVSAEEDFRHLMDYLKSKNTGYSAAERFFLNNSDFIFSQIDSLKQNLPVSAYEKLPKRIVHGDLKTKNIKWNGYEVAVLFDWERARQNQARIEDFKNALLTTDMKLVRKYNRADLVSFLEGYQSSSKEKLTQEELEAIPSILGPGAFLWDISRWLILRRKDMDSYDPIYSIVQNLVSEFRKVVDDFKGEWWKEEKKKLLSKSS